MSDAQFDAALDLLRRLNPTTLQENLNNLIELQPNLAQDLLSLSRRSPSPHRKIPPIQTG
ncbi:F-actin-capping protein subunit beta, partial [Saccharomyces cerevisiae]